MQQQYYDCICCIFRYKVERSIPSNIAALLLFPLQIERALVIFFISSLVSCWFCVSSLIELIGKHFSSAEIVISESSTIADNLSQRFLSCLMFPGHFAFLRYDKSIDRLHDLGHCFFCLHVLKNFPLNTGCQCFYFLMVELLAAKRLVYRTNLV